MTPRTLFLSFCKYSESVILFFLIFFQRLTVNLLHKKGSLCFGRQKEKLAGVAGPGKGGRWPKAGEEGSSSAREEEGSRKASRQSLGPTRPPPDPARPGTPHRVPAASGGFPAALALWVIKSLRFE